MGNLVEVTVLLQRISRIVGVHWIPGHSNVTGNEKADVIVRKQWSVERESILTSVFKSLSKK